MVLSKVYVKMICMFYTFS